MVSVNCIYHGARIINIGKLFLHHLTHNINIKIMAAEIRLLPRNTPHRHQRYENLYYSYRNNRYLCLEESRIYRVSQEERTKLRESVSYVKLYRYKPQHLYPKLNGYGDNGQRKVWTSCISAYSTSTAV